jgi:hypothetical protein
MGFGRRVRPEGGRGDFRGGFWACSARGLRLLLAVARLVGAVSRFVLGRFPQLRSFWWGHLAGGFWFGLTRCFSQRRCDGESASCVLNLLLDGFFSLEVCSVARRPVPREDDSVANYSLRDWNPEIYGRSFRLLGVPWGFQL